MRLSEVFERLVLDSARVLAPASRYGRRRALSDSDALTHIFTLLRTGMQWRELDSSVHCTTILRRFHYWKRLGVFEQAYSKALDTYQKLRPTKRYCVDSNLAGELVVTYVLRKKRERVHFDLCRDCHNSELCNSLYFTTRICVTSCSGARRIQRSYASAARAARRAPWSNPEEKSQA